MKAEGGYINIYISNSEYLVSNPGQAALQSYSAKKAKKYYEYFWLGSTVRSKAYGDLF